MTEPNDLDRLVERLNRARQYGRSHTEMRLLPVLKPTLKEPVMNATDLRAHLGRLQLTQTELAAVLAVGERTVRTWVSEGVKSPRMAARIEELKPSDPLVKRARRDHPVAHLFRDGQPKARSAGVVG